MHSAEPREAVAELLSGGCSTVIYRWLNLNWVDTNCSFHSGWEQGTLPAVNSFLSADTAQGFLSCILRHFHWELWEFTKWSFLKFLLTFYRLDLNPNVLPGWILLLPLGYYLLSGHTRCCCLLSSCKSIVTSIFWVSLENERIAHLFSQVENGIEKAVLPSDHNFTGL